MEAALISAMDNYYKLKHKYEKQLNDYKNKILKDETKTKLEKRALFKKFKPVCVNCEKPGGSLFTNKDRVLKAVCNSETPCKLNIQLNVGKYANILNLDENYSKNVALIKTNIIMTKLDFLFGYIRDENTAFENFDKLRKNLGHYMEAQLLVQRNFNEVAQNPEKTKAINLAEVKLYEEITELQNIYKLYLDNPKGSYITEMVELYLKTIEPLATQIREMKYVINVIEVIDAVDTRYALIQKMYTLVDLEQEVYGDIKSGIVKNVV